MSKKRYEKYYEVPVREVWERIVVVNADCPEDAEIVAMALLPKSNYGRIVDIGQLEFSYEKENDEIEAKEIEFDEG